jgi:hypothetical protein
MKSTWLRIFMVLPRGQTGKRARRREHGGARGTEMETTRVTEALSRGIYKGLVVSEY